MQAESKKVISVIVSFNGEKWIEKCLNSLIHSSLPNSVIVIDNGSVDNTVEIIKNKYKEVNLIFLEENLGFGKANNIGLKMALEESADYVFLLNQDAWVESSTLEYLVKVAERNPEYGVISPIHLNGSGDKLDLYFSRYASPEKCPGFYSDAVVRQGYKELYPIEFVNAAAWLLPLKTLETVGGFDPIFSHYGEDNNYIQRVHYHGLKVGICPDTRVFHDREERISKTRPNHKSIEIFKKNALVEYGNINIDGPAKLKSKIKSNEFRRIAFSLLRRNTNTLKLKKELKILYSIQKTVQDSWQKNKNKGPNHLHSTQK